jgi:hypothetical protein
MTVDLYNVLFELQLLHEYYLTDADQTSVFDPANISSAGATAYLSARQTQGRPSVIQVATFAPTAATQEVFQNQQLQLINTYSGFKVAVKVTKSTVSAGTTTYTPSIPMAATCNLLFLIQSPDGELGAISNGRMHREINSLYYFCNSTLTGNKSFPSLSNPVPAKQDPGAYSYDQGELVNDTTNAKSPIGFAYYAAGTTTAIFGNAGSTDNLVNETDRLLVGLQFNYTFQPGSAVTGAIFTLKDASGATVKTINSSSTTPLTSVALDFSVDAQGNPLAINTLPGAGLGDPILYTLTVTGTNYSKSFPLIFYQDPTELAGCWGLIQIQATVSAASYSLLGASGQLAAATPVFQIRCKSLPTFRLYRCNAGTPQQIQAASSLTNILVQSGNDLVTVQPVPLTYMPYFFISNQWPTQGNPPGPPGTVYLPGPGPDGPMQSDPTPNPNRLSSVILVPLSTLFTASTPSTTATASTIAAKATTATAPKKTTTPKKATASNNSKKT